MKNSKNKILVIAAHPDDEVLGCGGTIHKLSSLGHQVYVLVLSSGVKKDALKAAKTKAKSMKKANELLGVKKVFHLDFEDNYFDRYPIVEFVEAIEAVIKEITPNIIYTHNEADLNQDHRVIFEATIIASRFFPYGCIQKIYSYEVPSVTESISPIESKVYNPSTFVELTKKNIEVKFKALNQYEMEIRKYPHARNAKGIEVYARFRGLAVGVEYAEAFKLIRELN